MYRDRKHVLRAAREMKGKVLIGHVRWASNPLKLARHELIGTAHTQPFVWRPASAKATAGTRRSRAVAEAAMARRRLGEGGWIFAHNGTLYIPKEVAARLGPWEKYIKGKNDSEVLFYWLMKHLARSNNPAQAVRRSIQGIHRIWEGGKRSYPLHRYPYHGLNWILSDGKTLMAFCYTDPRGFGKSKALCDSRQSYYQLHRRLATESVVISSEPFDKESGWTGFRHGELFIARRQGDGVATRTVQVL